MARTQDRFALSKPVAHFISFPRYASGEADQWGNDVWIAAIAVQYDLTLVTRDAHFAFPPKAPENRLAIPFP
jgi:hypothetical protein